jgi:hypothetical protein
VAMRLELKYRLYCQSITHNFITERSFILSNKTVWFRKCATCNKIKDSLMPIKYEKAFVGRDATILENI